ncbi:MAG TPA: PilZ domain-containing protein, partial [Candidatus Omnitrophota bacterium]|nr:PilZ domain-containing protein [Candidatus Omnitrophota bacterium]
PYSGTPFKEFLIENVAYIQQTNPSRASHLAVKNIHQRAIDEARDKRLREAIDQRAAALIEEAIANSEVLLPKASEEMKAVVQQKASALIEEAIKNVEPPRLEETSSEIKSIVKEKAGGVIEQAVRDVEVLPLQQAPENVRIAAKQAASRFIEGAVVDVGNQNQGSVWDKINPDAIGAWGKDSSQWLLSFSPLELMPRDYGMIGLLILALLALLTVKIAGRNKAGQAKKEVSTVDPLKEPDSRMAKVSEQKTVLEKGEDDWMEKRKYRRVNCDFPVSLILDKVKPISAMVKNISLGGAYALCNDIKLLRLGDKCQFKCHFFDGNLDHGINGMVEVVRIRSARGLGLKFYDLDQKSMNYLLKF